MKQGILNLSIQDLSDFLSKHNFPRYRAKQICTWLLRFGKTAFSEMSNIDANLRINLDNWFYISRPKIVKTSKSIDGTVKFLLELNDQNQIEMVFIPDERRNTICLSSQIGCPIGCKFCNTGHNGFVRNLTTEEIVSQFLVAKDYLNLWGSETENLTNIVFMGMGEPLLNYENVRKAIDILNSDEKNRISRRKITISTAGISDVMRNIATHLTCRLAISLHAPNDHIRSKIMPINDKYPINSILQACDLYERHHEYLKITFEYLLLDGINDSNICAKELLQLLRGHNCKVNLLTFNSWEGCKFGASSSKRILEFASVLRRGGLESTIRTPRGKDVMAACGQLRSARNPVSRGGPPQAV